MSLFLYLSYIHVYGEERKERKGKGEGGGEDRNKLAAAMGLAGP